VIVITGVGRSGTSFLAQVYRELGFDPGGQWLPAVNAGYEDDEVVSANELVAHDLGLLFLGGPRPDPSGSGGGGLLNSLRARGRPAPPDQFDTIDPERLQPAVERHRDRLQAVAAAHVVVKDPRFCWTMPVWLRAGAMIDHVVLSTRAMDAVIASRRAAGHLRYRTEAAATNELIYALGVCLAAISEHDVPHSIVRFPHVLDCPELLASTLPLPEAVTPDRIAEAVRSVARRDLVHDWR
jgi:hypothetical protein